MNLHLRTSLGNIRRAPFQAMAAVLVLSVTFFVSTLIAVFVYASNQFLFYFETRPQIIAYINNEATNEQIDELHGRLREDLRVNDVRFVTKEEAFRLYKEATADTPLLGELVSPSTFPASIEFSTNDLAYAQELLTEIGNEEIVDEVDFTASLGGQTALSDVVTKLRTITFYTRIGGLVAIFVLAFTSFLVLMVVIGMRVSMKRKDIKSLNLIGATSWFIRAPIVMEAFHYSFLGVLVGWGLASVLLMYASPSIVSYFQPVDILPKEALDFFLMLLLILAVELFIGVAIAVVGSMTAVSRSLKVVK